MVGQNVPAIATLGGAVLSLQLVGITPKVCAAHFVRRYGHLLMATSHSLLSAYS